MQSVYYSSLIFYGLVILLTFFFAVLYERSKSLTSVVALGRLHIPSHSVVAVPLFLTVLAIPVLTLSLRYDVGIDYFSYIEKYYDVLAEVGTPQFWDFYQTEPLFKCLIVFCDFVFHDPTSMFTITALLTHVFVMIFFLKNPQTHFGVAMLGYMCFVFFPSLTIVRLALSAAIVAVAYTYIPQKKILPFTLLVLLAAMNHYTAIAAWPLYIYVNVLTQKKRHPALDIITRLLFWGILLFLVLNMEAILPAFVNDTKYESQLQLMTGDIKVPGFYLLVLWGLLFFFRKDLIAQHENNKVYLEISFAEILVRLFSYRFPLGNRMLYYLLIVRCMMLAALCKVSSKYRFGFLIYLFVVLYSLHFVYQNYLLISSFTIPYQTLWGWIPF